MVSDSLMNKEKRYISCRDLVFMSMTQQPGLVTGSHCLSSASPSELCGLGSAATHTAAEVAVVTSCGRLLEHQHHPQFSVSLE